MERLKARVLTGGVWIRCGACRKEAVLSAGDLSNLLDGDAPTLPDLRELMPRLRCAGCDGRSPEIREGGVQGRLLAEANWWRVCSDCGLPRLAPEIEAHLVDLRCPT
jgi:hypothetical protein